MGQTSLIASVATLGILGVFLAKSGPSTYGFASTTSTDSASQILASIPGKAVVSALGSGTAGNDHLLLNISPRRALAATGITPLTLAAAGVSYTDACGLVSLASGTWIVHRTSIGAAMHEASAAFARCQALEDRARTGKATPDDVNQLDCAKNARSEALSIRDDALEEFFRSVTVDLSQEQISALRNIEANSRMHLPLEYRVLELTEQEIVEIQRSLAGNRQAVRRGQAFADDRTTLTDARLVAVQNAVTALGTTLPQIEDLWTEVFWE